MEKYAVQDDDLIEGLRNEEHELMLKMSQHMSGHKTAAEEREFYNIQNRLQAVRDKITQHDLFKNKK